MKKTLVLAFALAISQPLWGQSTRINGSRVLEGTLNYCADAGSTDAYACNLSPAISGYTAGALYFFKANTANTGAATINLNALGAKPIMKVQGGITTPLEDNDIRAGQMVAVIYDGTNMQMLGGTGNVATGTNHNLLSTMHSDTLVDSPALGDLLYANSTPAWRRLAGNITTTNLFLSQTGTGTVSAAPGWGPIADADVPDTITLTNLTQITNRAIADTSGTLAVGRGGSGADLSATGGANQFLKQSSLGGAFTVGAIADADVPDTITLTNLTQITNRAIADTSGTLAVGRGGSGADLSATGGANQFLKQSSLGGAFTVGAIADADVPDTITLTNLTQITNRAIADTSGILEDARLSANVVLRNQAGSVNSVAKFTAASIIGNGLLTDDGSTVTLPSGLLDLSNANVKLPASVGFTATATNRLGENTTTGKLSRWDPVAGAAKTPADLDDTCTLPGSSSLLGTDGAGSCDAITTSAGVRGKLSDEQGDGVAIFQGGNASISSIGITIDGGGSAITAGVKGYVEVPFACTINRATTLADQSGSIVIDVWKDTYANYPPTVVDTIAASAKPTISTATKAQDTTLTGWTTAVTAGDIIGFNVDSATTVTRVHLILKCTKT